MPVQSLVVIKSHCLLSKLVLLTWIMFNTRYGQIMMCAELLESTLERKSILINLCWACVIVLGSFRSDEPCGKVSQHDRWYYVCFWKKGLCSLPFFTPNFLHFETIFSILPPSPHHALSLILLSSHSIYITSNYFSIFGTLISFSSGENSCGCSANHRARPIALNEVASILLERQQAAEIRQKVGMTNLVLKTFT